MLGVEQDFRAKFGAGAQLFEGGGKLGNIQAVGNKKIRSQGTFLNASRVACHSRPGKGAEKEFHEPWSFTSWRSRCSKVDNSISTSAVGIPTNTASPPGRTNGSPC